MAKRKSINKTQAIHRVMREYQTESPTEIVKLLKQQGIKVSTAYVSTIKSNDKAKAAKAGSRKRGRPPKQASQNGQVDLAQTSELLMKAVDLVLQSGGGMQARELITMADKLVSKIE